jgi:hypothetical protein
LFYKTSLLAAMHVLAMWYMPMHMAELIACIIFLRMKIFVCLIKQAHLLVIISKLGGGGDDSILWLSFAQQNCPLSAQNQKVSIFCPVSSRHGHHSRLATQDRQEANEEVHPPPGAAFSSAPFSESFYPHS